MDPEKASQLRSAVVWTVVLTAVHFVLGTRTHAGHGLALTQPGDAGLAGQTSSAALVAALPEVAELHIGHALIGHAVFVGLRQAIADFKAEAIRARRSAP